MMLSMSNEHFVEHYLERCTVFNLAPVSYLNISDFAIAYYNRRVLTVTLREK